MSDEKSVEELWSDVDRAVREYVSAEHGSITVDWLIVAAGAYPDGQDGDTEYVHLASENTPVYRLAGLHYFGGRWIDEQAQR
jgi:hypothetical protein